MKALKISKLILYFLSAALIILLLFVYIFAPLYQKTSDLTAEHNSNSVKINYYSKKISKIQDINNSIARKKDEFKNSQIMPGIQPSEIGKDLNVTLQKTGLKVNAITVGSETQVENIKKAGGITLMKVPISLDVSGEMDQFGKLLDGCETGSSAMYYINSFECDYNENNTGGQYSGKVGMTMYYCITGGNAAVSKETKDNE